ncbi:hypothetical protein TNCT_197901 [Trichonephila clavata]|uniref:Uncharacterized protein n=1 Tax=Trichonephila clavata TaxID=2740835 RepID=A0A8X6HZT4_TRICU|nr:hypothetical protein TNCT_197901 [Trichonephila clavata]
MEAVVICKHCRLCTRDMASLRTLWSESIKEKCGPRIYSAVNSRKQLRNQNAVFVDAGHKDVKYPICCNIVSRIPIKLNTASKAFLTSVTLAVAYLVTPGVVFIILAAVD